MLGRKETVPEGRGPAARPVRAGGLSGSHVNGNQLPSRSEGQCAQERGGGRRSTQALGGLGPYSEGGATSVFLNMFIDSREGERNINDERESPISCHLHTAHWRWGLKPGCVPQPGIEP